MMAPGYKELIALIQGSPWPGAVIDRTVLLGMLAIAEERSSDEILVSQRYLGERLDLLDRTVRYALDRLVRDGLISKSGVERMYSSQTQYSDRLYPTFVYRIERSSIFSRFKGSQNNQVLNEIESLSPSERLVWNTLGQTAKLVYDQLTAQPQTISELARTTGKAWNTVSNALRSLLSVRLVVLTKNGWVRGSLHPKNIPLDPDAYLGSAGGEVRKALDRKKELDQQRRAYKLFEEITAMIMVLFPLPLPAAWPEARLQKAAKIVTSYPCVHCHHKAWKPGNGTTDGDIWAWWECKECGSIRALTNFGGFIDEEDSRDLFYYEDDPDILFVYLFGELISLNTWRRLQNKLIEYWPQGLLERYYQAKLYSETIRKAVSAVC